MFQRILNVIVLLVAGVGMTPAAVVRGVVTDLNGDPLPTATVRLLRANNDSTFVTGGAANTKGSFQLNNVPPGTFILQASYIGYHNADERITIENFNQRFKADTLRLTENTIMLKEAVVHGVATPITAKEDTIEYNASSFTTPPNAVVSDLLKRLPGVEVGSDGSITAQGQTVKKILVDGEEFFSDDPQVASKNIPVNMVNKAQVITRKSDLARMTGVDDGEEETVINLTVKPEMKNGWFGTAEAGYGTDNTYKGSFIANYFKNSNTFTILGNANNINDAGFTDGNGGRFQRFGGMNGINTTQSLGANFNVGNKVLRVGGNVMYSHNDRKNESETNRQNIFAYGDNTITQSTRATRDKGHNVSGRFRLMWTPDSFNTFEFRPDFSINKNNSHSNSTDANYGITLEDRRSNSRNISTSDGTSYEFSGRLIYNHNFRRHKGRSISLSANYSFSNVHENQDVWSRNAYWMNDSTYEEYQLIKNHTWSNSVNARVTWTEPLGNVAKGNFLEVAYSMDYRWNNADKNVFSDVLASDHLTEEHLQWMNSDWGSMSLSDRLAGLHPDDLSYDQKDSNSFRNNYFNQQIRLGYKKVHKDYNLNVGLSFNPQMSRSTNLTDPDKTIPTRWVWNYAPFARFRYKFSKQTSLNLFYNGRSSAPSLTQLQPVEDSSDPMNVVQGNPDLDPSFSHSLRARFQTFNMDRQQSIMVMLNGGFTQNAIASNIKTNRETGGRYTTYENVNGNWNIGFFSMFSQPFGSSKLWSFSNYLNANHNQSVGFTDGYRNRSGSTRVGESFAIAFRPNDLELEIRPNYNLQLTTNSIGTLKNQTVHRLGGSFNGTWYTHFGLVLSTDLNYNKHLGYSEGYNTSEWNWNASISYMFLRNQNATIAIKGYDLLNQSKSVMRSETAQAITDSRNLVLGRYVMATFTYKFSTFAGGKTPERSGDDGFMRGGPGGMGRPPMGGPGGGPGGPR